jgi:hypothetical protein
MHWEFSNARRSPAEEAVVGAALCLADENQAFCAIAIKVSKENPTHCAHGCECPQTAPFASGFCNACSVRERFSAGVARTKLGEKTVLFFLELPPDFRECSQSVMISIERPSPFRTRPATQPGHPSSPRPDIREDTLKSERMLCERKSFNFLLKENPRGRFLRIVEEGGRFNASIIIPLSGLKEFQMLLAEMTKAANKLP